MRPAILAIVVGLALAARPNVGVADGPVQCMDGTMSPTCKTSDARKSGCCSGHGGVAPSGGCGGEPPPE